MLMISASRGSFAHSRTKASAVGADGLGFHCMSENSHTEDATPPYSQRIIHLDVFGETHDLADITSHLKASVSQVNTKGR